MSRKRLPEKCPFRKQQKNICLWLTICVDVTAHKINVRDRGGEVTKRSRSIERWIRD